MKRVGFAFCILLGCLPYSTTALAQPAPSVVLQPQPSSALQQMGNAIRALNYEIHFINISRQGIESLRYRHARIDNRPLAQLLFMDGPRREIVQRDRDISYFDADLEPFSLSGDHIIDSFPSLVYADYQSLSAFYDFIPAAGRVRIADRLCEGMRIISRDGTRYSYSVWFDVATKLPLRIDLQDRNGERLEQFLVTSLVVSDDIRETLRPLLSESLPPLLTTPTVETVNLTWIPEWLPQGMKEISRSSRTLPGISIPVESRLFSDGLFSFSVNITPSSESRAEQYVTTGRRSVHTEIRNGYEVTVVGELPPATAKRIADNVLFQSQ